jgi:hypothetical protein
MGLVMRKVLTLANGLRLAAIGLAIYAWGLPGVWAGAGVMFLLWWADNDSKREAAKERELQRVAEHAPELKGMPDGVAMAYVLQAIDTFKENATDRLDMVTYTRLEEMTANATLPYLAAPQERHPS